MTFKEYIAERTIGEVLHFKCDCLFPMDFTGRIIGYHISSGCIIFHVQSDSDNKVIEIGENHPNMTVEEK